MCMSLYTCILLLMSYFSQCPVETESESSRAERLVTFEASEASLRSDMLMSMNAT